MALSPQGHKQSQLLADMVSAFGPDVCYTSPLNRCMQTASTLLSGQTVEITPCALLRELDFGDWEGMAYRHVAATEPNAMKQMWEFDPDFSPPGGENMRLFLDRVEQSARLLQCTDHAKVLVVTHGGVARALLSRWLTACSKHAFHAIAFGPGSAAEVTLFEGGAVLRQLIAGKEFASS